MTTTEAKRDAKQRLDKAGLAFTKLTAKTVNFTDLARCSPVFIDVHGLMLVKGIGLAGVFDDLPKPSEGGYVARPASDVQWID